MDFFIFAPSTNEDYCLISDTPEEIKLPEWRIAKGLPMGERFSGRPGFRISRRHEGTLVPDMVNNLLGYLMVSDTLKKALIELDAAEIEFLPFEILDQRGRVIAEDYSVANVIGSIDCIDLDHSEGDFQKGESQHFTRIHKLALDTSRIPADAKLFRLASLPTIFIIRSDLRDSLRANGFTGMTFVDLAEAYELV